MAGPELWRVVGLLLNTLFPYLCAWHLFVVQLLTADVVAVFVGIQQTLFHMKRVYPVCLRVATIGSHTYLSLNLQLVKFFVDVI